MTEYERVQAEYEAWLKRETASVVNYSITSFEAGWLAAKDDTKRLQQETAAPGQKPIPTFDEWFLARNGHVLCRVPGTMISDYMLDLSANLRAYVSEMVQRR